MKNQSLVWLGVLVSICVVAGFGACQRRSGSQAGPPSAATSEPSSLSPASIEMTKAGFAAAGQSNFEFESLDAGQEAGAQPSSP